MKKIVTAAALALAGLSLGSTQAVAALPYTNGDLLLGFRASGGAGASRDYVVNLGSATQFSGGTGTITLSGIGNIGADLATTGGALGLFGPSWNTRADVFWGIVGTDLGGDPANTLYASRPRTSPLYQSSAWVRRSNSAQSSTNSLFRAYISGYVNSDANAVSPKGTIQATSFANSYAQFTSGGVDFSFFQNIEGDFGAGAAGSVLDLFKVVPSTSGGISTHLGYFSIANDGTLSFTFDSGTTTPSLTSPAANSATSSLVAVSFGLPEPALPGSVKLDFTGATSSTLTLSGANETSAAHSFSFDPASPTSNANVISGAAIPDGYYDVSLTYQDLEGNTAATTTSSNVLIDHAAPVLDVSGVTTTGYTNIETLPDLRPSVTVTDISLVSFTQSPAPGVALNTGTLDVTFTATDKVGHVTSQSVTLDIARANPITSSIARRNDPVPGAGVTGSGVPATAKFASFTFPAINDAGQIAFYASWTAVPIKNNGGGIFAGAPNSPALIAKIGDPVPGISGATFRSFRDPVINEDGAVAFQASIGGITTTGPVTLADNQVLVTNAFPGGALTVVARTGAASGEADGSLLRSFVDISLQGGELLYTSTLKGGTPLVVATNDQAAFAVTSTGTRRIVREGQQFGTTTVKAYRLLGAVSGSANQTRAHSIGVATFLLLLADGTQAIVDGDGSTLQTVVATNQLTGGTLLPAATFRSFGYAAADGANVAFASNLNANVGGVLAANVRGIFSGSGTAFEPLARIFKPVPGIANSVFVSLSDPLLVDGTVAFPAAIRDTVTKLQKTSFWWKKGSDPLTEIVDLGSPVPDVPAGAQWRAFGVLGLAGGTNPSAIFTAYLKPTFGGVDATNDFGLWAVDHTGELRLLVREGGTIDGKPVRTFYALNAVAGSNGVTHSFNNSRKVIYRVIYADGTTGIATTTIP